MTRTHFQLSLMVVAGLGLSQLPAVAAAGWIAGDFHQHSLHSDGSWPMAVPFAGDDYFGLDWWANSEHGGSSGGLYRWQDLGGFVTTYKGQPNSWSEVLAGRSVYPSRIIVQGVEWNVPGHEHCSVGIIANQFSATPNAHPVAEFEYRFDAGDSDRSGGPGGIWTGKNTVNNHTKAVQAVTWAQQYYPDSSWIVFAHVERKLPTSGGYTISAFRDFHNAAPTIAMGFESMPGHQRDGNRGGYSTGAVGGGAYGGCGIYSAKVGGLWDALLGEGRHFWLFASSDFHDYNADYLPGQYQKTHTYVADKSSPQAIVDGMRSGNNFIVNGDLVNSFELGAVSGSVTAVMGEDMHLGLTPTPPGSRVLRMANVTLRIDFSSPDLNNAPAPINNVPVVDHVDIISGQITGVVAPGSANYNDPVNPTSKVIARIYNPDIYTDGSKPVWTNVDEIKSITLPVRISKNTYFRVRGTNCRIGVNTADIDDNGNPVGDFVNSLSGDAEAWTDLWFYSNPLFVYMN